MHFVLNDIEPDVFKTGPKVEFFREYTDLYIHPDWLSEYSQLWGLLRQRYLRQVAGSRYIQQCLESYSQDPSKFERMWSAMEGIRDWCSQHDAGLVVAVFPFLYQLNGNYPFRPIHEQIKVRCEQAGIPVLDLYPAFKSYSGPELWVHPVDQHPNEKAHAIVAETLFQFLLQNKQRLKLFVRRPASGSAAPSYRR